MNCIKCLAVIDPPETKERSSPRVLVTEHCGYWYRWVRVPKFPSRIRGFRYRFFCFGSDREAAANPMSRIILEK
jgi:hypothetical protein